MLVEINVISLNRLLILKVNQRLHMLCQFVYKEIANDNDDHIYQSLERVIIEWENELNTIDHILNSNNANYLKTVVGSLNKLLVEILTISKVIASYTFQLLAIYNDLCDIVLIIERYVNTGELLICDTE